MAPKRPLGIGKAAKAKKQKKESTENESVGETAASNELTVELDEEIEANDAVAQLKALWKTYFASEDKSELMLNGIIHECDRILRKTHNTKEQDEDDEKIELSGRFYAIYALALSSLAFYHTEDLKKVNDFFAEAFDRIESGRKAFPDSVDLAFAEAKIMISRIPLVEVSQLLVDSRVGKERSDVSKSLDASLAKWEEAQKQAVAQNHFHHYNAENFDFLQALDDLLDMVDNFGQEIMEGEDSDAEEDEKPHVELDEGHPLFAIKSSDKYNLWWREQTIAFLDHLNKNIENASAKELPALAVLKRELCKRLGQSYLMEAEVPANVFTTLSYYSKDAESLNGLTRVEAQKISQDLFKRALTYLKQAQDEQEPETWVNVAEAMISLGNTYEIDSKEQEETYKEAEAILVKANNATNGKYEDILENLMQG
ncbi:putative enhancer of translation termination protein [Clavispora lusitaniae]|uniref:Enhancer of translation termination 1 n=2 Tax=Clavispora lusitaniae TaxID=36911 RepID=A0AA91T0B6_CLALS|nr:putative enhancer of translation termination [Clavispora lusitaniae]QFZ29993.1 putative enhancer of translation termination protein [Clavispora lusitaniae]QFZ35657.1 putative enhancer of translation termination protein [Clavispora lusitaniae]QFZ41339.1 putative enhancer of translation termination protein [Clavispora lusitaniae]QFZ47017.1 putative enhancer of translation termination protein [Clavispora lusitaniae]